MSIAKGLAAVQAKYPDPFAHESRPAIMSDVEWKTNPETGSQYKTKTIVSAKNGEAFSLVVEKTPLDRHGMYVAEKVGFDKDKDVGLLQRSPSIRARFKGKAWDVYCRICGELGLLNGTRMTPLLARQLYSQFYNETGRWFTAIAELAMGNFSSSD